MDIHVCTHRVRHPNLYTSGSAEGKKCRFGL